MSTPLYCNVNVGVVYGPESCQLSDSINVRVRPLLAMLHYKGPSPNMSVTQTVLEFSIQNLNLHVLWHVFSLVNRVHFFAIFLVQCTSGLCWM